MLLSSAIEDDVGTAVFKTNVPVGINENSVLAGIDTGITVIEDVDGVGMDVDDTVPLPTSVPVGKVIREPDDDPDGLLVELLPL